MPKHPQILTHTISIYLIIIYPLISWASVSCKTAALVRALPGLKNTFLTHVKNV